MDNAIQVIVDGCPVEMRCRSAFPNLEQSLLAMFDQPKDRPVELVLTRPDIGKPSR